MELHPDLSFCRTEDRFVFLDLERDRYFCLDEGLARAFAALLEGTADHNDRLRLEERGLIVPREGRPMAACPATIPHGSLLDARASAPLSRIVSLAWEFRRMRATLRRHGLAGPAARLAGARRAAPQVQGSTALIESAMAYDRLALLRGAHDLCLPHALALAILLARRGYAAEVVLGIQLRPFSAHCWVEHAGQLVNDRFDRVRFYTPIRRL